MTNVTTLLVIGLLVVAVLFGVYATFRLIRVSMLSLTRDSDRMAISMLSDEIAAAAPDAIMVIGPTGLIVDANFEATRLFGYPKGDLLGRDVSMLIPESVRGRHQDLVKTYLGTPVSRRMGALRSVEGQRSDGSLVPLEVGLSPIERSGGTHVIAIARDVTEQELLTKRLEQLAYYDDLTGLPNRELFRRRLDAAISRAGSSNSSLALLFIDLDGFKHVNDSYGHNTGDAFLRSVSGRLVTSLRTGDPIGRGSLSKSGGGSLSRLGGDEFTVLIPRLRCAEDAGRIADRILQALGAPILAGSHSIHASASVGIAIYPSDGLDAASLLRSADSAMYMAKSAGRGNFRYSSQELNQRLERRARIATDLPAALDRQGLELHFQPIVNSRSHRLEATEALLRWKHPDLGWVNPEEIISVSREVGLTQRLGHWVLVTALDELSAWLRANLPIQRMCINVSPDQLSDPDFYRIVSHAISERGLSPEHIEIELTEQAVVQNDPAVRRNIECIASRQVGLALDDFGTGYSSLSHLVQLPVQRVKIDRSFIGGIGSNMRCETIVAGLVRLVKSLGLQSVAEGVETTAQDQFVRACGCEEAQGYFFGAPCSSAAITEMLQRLAIDARASHSESGAMDQGMSTGDVG